MRVAGESRSELWLTWWCRGGLHSVGVWPCCDVRPGRSGLNPAWAAAAGTLMLAVRGLWRHTTSPGAIGRAAAVPFLAVVLALGIVVAAVVNHGLGCVLVHLVPAGGSLWALPGITALGAGLANVINNLPAVLVLALLHRSIVDCAGWDGEAL